MFRDNIGETLATNSRFTENPSQYLKDKLTEAVFRRIWSTVVAKNLQTLVDAAWNNELQSKHDLVKSQTLPRLSFSYFS